MAKKTVAKKPEAPNCVLETGIPIPNSGRGTRVFYPWDHLKKSGDSFLIRCPDGERFIHQARILQTWRSDRRDRPFSITTRKVEGGLRVWRI